jgi:hypothetical protein
VRLLLGLGLVIVCHWFPPSSSAARLNAFDGGIALPNSVEGLGSLGFRAGVLDLGAVIAPQML